MSISREKFSNLPTVYTTDPLNLISAKWPDYIFVIKDVGNGTTPPVREKQ